MDGDDDGGPWELLKFIVVSFWIAAGYMPFLCHFNGGDERNQFDR
jgi:hypothetical protein